MNRNLLIDGIVRQTILTIAQLATTGGVRTPLAHVANEVFIGLAKELEQQGLGRKVIADMFGLTLRAYHSKVRRLSESRTVRGRSLWTAVLDFVTQRTTVSRAEVEKRFSRDDAISVAGILNDLVKSGLLFRTGDGPATIYRAAEPSDVPLQDDSDSCDAFVWAEVYRSGPIDLARLSDSFPTLKLDILRSALSRLQGRGQIVQHELDGQSVYHSSELLIPLEAEDGWEAAVLDHFQAVAKTISKKAQQLVRKASVDDATGGSTFHFDLNAEHPLREDVLLLFKTFREEASQLRNRVDQTSRDLGLDSTERITLYLGQVSLNEDE